MAYSLGRNTSQIQINRKHVEIHGHLHAFHKRRPVWLGPVKFPWIFEILFANRREFGRFQKSEVKWHVFSWIRLFFDNE